MSAYWIAHVRINDPARYKNYMDLAPAAFKHYNARFLARGGEAQTLEGESGEKHVLIEFSDYQTALACYHSEAYQKARKERQDIADAIIVIVEGLA